MEDLMQFHRRFHVRRSIVNDDVMFNWPIYNRHYGIISCMLGGEGTCMLGGGGACST